MYIVARQQGLSKRRYEPSLKVYDWEKIEIQLHLKIETRRGELHLKFEI